MEWNTGKALRNIISPGVATKHVLYRRYKRWIEMACRSTFIGLWCIIYVCMYVYYGFQTKKNYKNYFRQFVWNGFPKALKLKLSLLIITRQRNFFLYELSQALLQFVIGSFWVKFTFLWLNFALKILFFFVRKLREKVFFK